jgi:Family of unknown function (DUF6492)
MQDNLACMIDSNPNDLFDIVIPLGPNDIHSIHTMIQHTKKNIIGYRNIYLVSYDPTIKIDGCITIDESIFPFNKQMMPIYEGKDDRRGWYLQQLIKLYAGFVIETILDHYLVIDSDTFFLKPTTFFKDHKPLYNFGDEYHIPYFEHMRKLHPSLTCMIDVSGICHHMMFQKQIVGQLFKLVEEYHHEPFYISFLKHVNPKELSGASEYEIYFNYLHQYHNNTFLIRKLNWKNGKYDHHSNYDYISHHWYMKE